MNAPIRCNICGCSSGKLEYDGLPDNWATLEVDGSASKWVLAYCPDHAEERINSHFKNFKRFVTAKTGGE